MDDKQFQLEKERLGRVAGWDTNYMLEIAIKENFILREFLKVAIGCPGMCDHCREPTELILKVFEDLGAR